MPVPLPGARRHPRHAHRRGHQARGELSLLDADALRAGDPEGLVDTYRRFDEQLRRSYAVAADIAVDAGPARSVLFCGMGGSAAAADVVISAYEDDAPVEMSVRRGPRLPAWVGRDTLVVCLSYSGGTGETVMAFDEAAGRGARTVAISHGGRLGERAREAGVHIAIPGDAPRPRAALGDLTGAALGALVAAGVLDDRSGEVDAAASTLRRSAEALALGEADPAASTASWLADRMPVIWGTDGVSGPAAWRWKCAFNENAKIPAFASVLPELAHHEVVGWSRDHIRAVGLIVLREPDQHPSVLEMLDAVLAEVELDAHTVSAEGDTPLARALTLMQVGDVASAYHAVARGIDPGPIEAIDRVKARLSG